MCVRQNLWYTHIFPQASAFIYLEVSIRYDEITTPGQTVHTYV